MGHELELIPTLLGALAAALLFGVVTQRLRLSPLVGYLLAGIAVGPFTPGFVAHAALARQFAELGVILLLFGVGLQFHIEDLLAVRRLALPGALVQMTVAACVGLTVCKVLGWSTGSGLAYGLSVSVASTVVVLRVLSDHDAVHTPAGHAAIGWLVVQDVMTVAVLVLLPILSGAGPSVRSPTAIAGAIGVAALKIGALVGGALLIGRRLLPRVLGYVASTRSRELFTLTVLVLALGIAVGSAVFFGASMALGAFLAGMIVGQSEFGSRAASEALPMRDAFAVLFFVSMGMLLDPTKLVSTASLTLPTLAIVLICNPLVALGTSLGLRAPPRTAVTVALALAQVGEFTFIVAALGQSLGLLPERATQALVCTSIVSITLNPLLFRLERPLTSWLVAALPSGATARQEAVRSASRAPLAIVVGYGPVGRSLVRLLGDNGIHPVVVELNHETVNRLTSEGIEAIYGDASQAAILERAGVHDALSLAFAASGSPDAVIREARRLNPELVVLVRATYIGEVPALERAGANIIVPAEREVAFAMTEHLLRRLGATSEQLDRARDRVRSELDQPGEATDPPTRPDRST